MRVLNERLAGRELDLTDGIKVFDERGWAQVLPDPDEPLIHIYAEGETTRTSEELERELRALVEEIEQGEAAAGANLKAQPQVDPCGAHWLTSSSTLRTKGRRGTAPRSRDALRRGAKQLIDDLTEEEQEVSYRRRLLHGKIDILRAELVARLQKTEGRSVLDAGRRRAR